MEHRSFSSNFPNSSLEDHHCHDHKALAQACEACRRARAAFLTYPSSASVHTATRSFGFTDQMNQQEIYSLAHPVQEVLLRSLMREIASEEIGELIDLLLPGKS